MRQLILALGLLGVSWGALAEVSVTTAQLDRLAQPVEAIYPANTEALEHSMISAGIAAEIERIEVRPGDSVERGDVLVRLDCRDAKILESRAQDAKAEADIRLAFQQRQAGRVAKLAETNIASEELKDTRATDVRLAEVAVKQAATALDDARLQVSRCVIRAPFDAVIVEQLASRGTRVAIGTPILDVVSQAADIRARVPLDFSITPGQRFEFDSPIGRRAIELITYSRAVDTQTGTRLMRFQGIGESFGPGVPGQLRVQSDALTVPADFLVERAGVYGLMAVDGETAAFIPRPGATLGQPVDVTDLSAALQLIVEGRFRARAGDVVSVMP